MAVVLMKNSVCLYRYHGNSQYLRSWANCFWCVQWHLMHL